MERHNLPAPLTSFVGREQELDDLAELLRTHRLVTLTGLGRMPHVASSVVDEKGAKLIHDWIKGMGK